ncbi:tyrosine-protein phosphatase 69D, partial [Hyalella azteca]|uniref:protein-tyrosine-phosphatase n=1 Tax=Hyalella azteca TaxID=294128 RepID=A0A979FM32_HYAAZ
SVDHYKLEFASMANYIDEEGQKRYEDDRREENVSVNLTSYQFTGATANTNYTVKVGGRTPLHRYGEWRDPTTPTTPSRWVAEPYNTNYTVKVGGGASQHPLYTVRWVAGPHNTNYTVKVGGGTLQHPLHRQGGWRDPTTPTAPSRWVAGPYNTHYTVKVGGGTPQHPLHRQGGWRDTTTPTTPSRIVVVKLGRGRDASSLGRPADLPLVTHAIAHRRPATAAYVAEAYTRTSDRYLLLGDNRTVGGNWSQGCGACIQYPTSPSSPPTEPTPITSPPPTTTLIPTTRPSSPPPPPSPSSPIPDTTTTTTTTATPPPAKVVVKRSPDPSFLQVVDGAFSTDHNYTGYLILTVNSEKEGPLHSYSEYFNVVHPVMSEPFKRKLFRSLRKSNTLLSQNCIEVKPIAKDDLVQVYLENIKDSELGFRREYEALPEKFVDRSTRVSEMFENSSKNRYPDIKAYDQTRVKLSTSAAHPSDYINANYVLGYKERKKFICAQGPMDATVDDFWRMIVDQGCGICVMLTNLCSSLVVHVMMFITGGSCHDVHHCQRDFCADYIVRTLRAEWLVPSELKYHEVEQYHYLMWKDFVAPEHPVGILAFLRRMNEAHSHEKGPLLVHCSAGVGRTGTLVALDSLVMELDDEKQASVYNLICDLRHQRNFLVQSLKQYVFIHRALMEYAQFGSTEQTPQQLREAYVKHVNQVQQQHASPILFTEFDLLSKVIEERKAFTIATSEENKSRNRYDYVLPYDSNRVILSPVAGKPVNTYINASFVSGFDLDEYFIVTQDPLENTVSDFWRMIFEQDVTTIVMLSELGSGDDLCARYWPEDDEEAQHDNVIVKLISSESYPKFSSRVFQVSHSKNGGGRQVTQFQYVGWSGQMGEVPVGTYGIMELINRVHSHIHANLSSSMPAPVVLHCSGGGDRCSVYVCLNNCLRQLRREARVDVFQIARKIRSMRQFMLQEPTQYEFCYKALIEYIDSKGLDNI